MSDFEILHFSIHYPRPVMKYPFFKHNLVWRAYDKEFKDVCMGMADEWQRTEVVFDKTLAEEYINGLSFNIEKVDNQFGYSSIELVQKDGIRRDTVFHKGWQRQFPFVYYLEKFDCFRTWGFTEVNAVTMGCVHELRTLQLNEKMYSGRFATWCHFRRLLTTLDSFWD